MRKFDGPFGAVVGLTGVLLAATSLPARAQTFDVLYSFTGFADGGQAQGGVVRDAADNIYGTTSSYGSGGGGTLFRIDPAGKFSVMVSFDSEDGAGPIDPLLLNTAGDLYGTTWYEGAYGYGTVFEVNALGLLKVLHNFTGGTDGANPSAGLISDAAGNLYGTTLYGGDLSCNSGTGCGTVFKLTPSGKETVLYSFTGAADGRFPQAGLVADVAGNLYGTTIYGGDLSCNSGTGCGTVFKVDRAGAETVLYSFTGGTDGQFPYAGLVRDPAGDLFGTTSNGGASAYGTVFEVDKAGTETVLHSFAAGADGATPVAGLVIGGAGNLYGTTEGGGTHNSGTVFEVTASGTETVLHSFNGQSGGANPNAGLLRDSAGNLYGTTLQGGVYLQGTVFKLKPRRRGWRRSGVSYRPAPPVLAHSVEQHSSGQCSAGLAFSPAAFY
jgi:uncharacterized repeat protein (TIGR03803 family)